MLAIVYLAFMFWVGDSICRRFYRFVSVPHRLAAAFLVGMLISSWFTYLAARIFASTTRPLLWGDLLFFAATIGGFVWMRRKEKAVRATSTDEFAGETGAPSETSQAEEASAVPAEAFAAPATERMASQAEATSSSQASAEKMSALSAEENPDGSLANVDQASELSLAEMSAGSVNPHDGSPLADENSSAPAANSDEVLADDIKDVEDSSALPAGNSYLPRPAGSDRLDWLFIGAYFIFACWLMFASLNSANGKLKISGRISSDFGPNTALVQSFAVGKNFPTQYPHFAGEKIRYHFLFWFQAGNLEFLGLDPAWSINLLSIFSMVALLMLTMVLGEVLFRSRVVGRVGSALFFFFGSLSYLPFLRKQESLGAALRAVTSLNSFLPSIYPYRGEAWGFYSQNIFINQRHISGAIGILLLVLIFLVLRYREVPLKKMNWR